MQEVLKVAGGRRRWAGGAEKREVGGAQCEVRDYEVPGARAEAGKMAPQVIQLFSLITRHALPDDLDDNASFCNGRSRSEPPTTPSRSRIKGLQTRVSDPPECAGELLVVLIPHLRSRAIAVDHKVAGTLAVNVSKSSRRLCSPQQSSQTV